MTWVWSALIALAGAAAIAGVVVAPDWVFVGLVATVVLWVLTVAVHEAVFG